MQLFMYERYLATHQPYEVFICDVAHELFNLCYMPEVAAELNSEGPGFESWSRDVS
jgi:hypothetical protein